MRPGTDLDWPQFESIVSSIPEASRWARGYPSLLIESGSVVAAFALYRIVAGEGELLNLAVSRDHRRRGFALQLLQALFALAPIWHLEVRESNAPAIALYTRAGFHRIGRRANYYSDGEAALLYSFTSATGKFSPPL